MKKVFNLFAIAAIMVASTLICQDSFAQVEEEIGDDLFGGKVTCYSTYNNGTTNFTKCNGCTETTGSNLTDSGKCRP
jgi:hypothetical protein